MTKEEIKTAQDKFQHKCNFCERKFKSESAMLTHRVACVHNYATTEEVFEVEGIVDVFVRKNARW